MRDQVAQTRLSLEERELINRVAERQGLTLAAWLRMSAIRFARQSEAAQQGVAQ